MKTNQLFRQLFLATLLSVFVAGIVAFTMFPKETSAEGNTFPQATQPGNTFPQATQPGNTFPQGGGSRTIQNPLKVNSISEFIAVLLNAVIAIGVPISILFIVLAGFKFITAQGSPNKLSEARSNFLYVIVGVAIFIGASALAQLVMATLRQIGVNV